VAKVRYSLFVHGWNGLRRKNESNNHRPGNPKDTGTILKRAWASDPARRYYPSIETVGEYDCIEKIVHGFEFEMPLFNNGEKI